MEKNELEKIAKLEIKLEKICFKENLKAIDGFTVMYDDENGHTIRYVKNMPKTSTSNSLLIGINLEENQEWPYTGFAIGNNLGWKPISHKEIIKILTKYEDNVEDFIKIEENFKFKWI